jgi:hypothetical protein
MMGSRWNKGTSPGAFCEHLEVVVIVNKENETKEYSSVLPKVARRWLV